MDTPTNTTKRPVQSDNKSDIECHLEPLLSPSGGGKGRTEGGHGDLRWPGSPWKERVGFEQARVSGARCRAPVSANVMVKPPCAVSDVVPPYVGARTATSAGVRFRGLVSGRRSRFRDPWVPMLGGSSSVVNILPIFPSIHLPTFQLFTAQRRQRDSRCCVGGTSA